MVRFSMSVHRSPTTFLEPFLSYTISKYFCETSDFGLKKWHQFEESPTGSRFANVFIVARGNFYLIVISGSVVLAARASLTYINFYIAKDTNCISGITS